MKKSLLAVAIVASLLAGCASEIPKDALSLSPTSLQDRQLQTRKFNTVDNAAMLAAATGVLQDLGFSIEEADESLGVLVGAKTRDATSGAQVAGAVVLAALTGVAMSVDTNQVIRVSLVMRETKDSAEAASKNPIKGIPNEDLAKIRKTLQSNIQESLSKNFDKTVSEKVAQKTSELSTNQLNEDVKKILAVETKVGDSTVRVTFQRVIFNDRGHISKAEQINDPMIYKEFFERLSKSVFLEAQQI